MPAVETKTPLQPEVSDRRGDKCSLSALRAAPGAKKLLAPAFPGGRRHAEFGATAGRNAPGAGAQAPLDRNRIGNVGVAQSSGVTLAGFALGGGSLSHRGRRHEQGQQSRKANQVTHSHVPSKLQSISPRAPRGILGIAEGHAFAAKPLWPRLSFRGRRPIHFLRLLHRRNPQPRAATKKSRWMASGPSSGRNAQGEHASSEGPACGETVFTGALTRNLAGPVSQTPQTPWFNAILLRRWCVTLLSRVPLCWRSACAAWSGINP